MRLQRLEALEEIVRGIRTRLDPAFAPDTAVAGTGTSVPSAGHCAAVALVVNVALGGDLMSTNYRGESHWFNRLATDEGIVDVDLTGDQFGLAPVRLAAAGGLFADSRRRQLSEANDNTFERAARLADRAGLTDVAVSIAAEVGRRRASRARASA